MIRTHPVHGTKAVFFHIQKVALIEGMTPEDSKTYMADLIDRMIQPEITYQHQWRKGDAFWSSTTAPRCTAPTATSTAAKAASYGASWSRATGLG